MTTQTEAMKRWVEVFDGNWHDEPVDTEWADRAHQALAEMRQAIAEAEQPAQQEPPANKYNDKRIAWELERTAMGDGYYGNALYVAMDMPQVTAADKAMLHRYMHGSNTKTDHVKLQDLAMRIYTTPQPPAQPLTDEENSKLFDSLIDEMLEHSYQGSHDSAEKAADEIRRMYKAAHGIRENT